MSAACLLRPAAALLAAVAVIGCGDSDSVPAGGAGVAGAGQGGTLAWALAERPAELDPLFASTPSERLVSRQIHEPLVEELSGSFDDPRRAPGLALSVRASRADRVWRLGLRPGVRFQDGTPMDAQAVIANARRWQALPSVSGLPPEPELFVFSPRPGQVTFKLAAPDPHLERLLASPRLGLVSPRALGEAGSEPLSLAQVADSGTGPFELRERAADWMLLARNADWWGSDRGLGPALDQLELPIVEGSPQRLAELEEGSVQVAGELRPSQVRRLRRDPLLTALPDGIGTATGAERSVRGIPAGTPAPPLNAVWLTRISAG
jgi:peptide/nickel transport system substrate-binding protein